MAEDALWLASSIARALGCVLKEDDERKIGGVSIDSRSVQAGDLFFAIQGERFDGHQFVDQALENGAAFAVVSEDGRKAVKAADAQLFIVSDVLSGLEALGRAARQRLRQNARSRVVAVTGSVGKTGTKEALRLAFSACGKTHASVASFNNHWGVPLTLARTHRDCDFAVYEIGMNHAGEITPLVDMVRPHIAIITTVGPVHLEFFDDEMGIARAKAEIFSGVEPGGYAVLNHDNHHFDLLCDLARKQAVSIVSFGENKNADVRLLKADFGEEGSKVDIAIHDKRYTYSVGAPGHHMVQNSLAVAAALHLTDADVSFGLAALAKMSAPKGRGQRLTLAAQNGAFTVLDESYNANPTSMRAALGLLAAAKPRSGGRRIAVLGDMLELGETSEMLHAGLAADLEKAQIDVAFLCGPHMKALFDALPPSISKKYGDESADVKESLVNEVAKGDVVMVKGSLGSRMGLLVDSLIEAYGPATS